MNYRQLFVIHQQFYRIEEKEIKTWVGKSFCSFFSFSLSLSLSAQNFIVVKKKNRLLGEEKCFFRGTNNRRWLNKRKIRETRGSIETKEKKAGKPRFTPCRWSRRF
jgi:hypothetical protein